MVWVSVRWFRIVLGSIANHLASIGICLDLCDLASMVDHSSRVVWQSSGIVYLLAWIDR